MLLKENPAYKDKQNEEYSITENPTRRRINSFKWKTKHGKETH